MHLRKRSQRCRSRPEVGQRNLSSITSEVIITSGSYQWSLHHRFLLLSWAIIKWISPEVYSRETLWASCLAIWVKMAWAFLWGLWAVWGGKLGRSLLSGWELPDMGGHRGWGAADGGLLLDYGLCSSHKCFQNGLPFRFPWDPRGVWQSWNDKSAAHYQRQRN